MILFFLNFFIQNMDKICNFLKDYYADNGISEYKSLIAFKYTKKNNNY